MKLRALALLGLLGLSSCLELEQTVTLRADGSGVLTFRMAMRESTLAEVRRASAAVEASRKMDPSMLFDKAVLERELRIAGFRVEKLVTERRAARRTMHIEAAFGDFATLQRTPLGGTAAEWVLGRGPRPGTAKLTYYPQGRAAWLESRRKARELKEESDPMFERLFLERKRRMAGLDLKLRMRVPGRVILWTKNMKRIDEHTVEARVSASEIRTLEDMIRRLSPRFEVIFDAQGFSLPGDPAGR